MSLKAVKVSAADLLLIRKQAAENDLIFTDFDANEVFIVPVKHDNDDKKSTTNIVVNWMNDIKDIAEKIYDATDDEEELALAQGILSYCDAVITTVNKS